LYQVDRRQPLLATEATRPSGASTVHNGPQRREVWLFFAAKIGPQEFKGPVAQLVRAHA
jgi:hypothetical protein